MTRVKVSSDATHPSLSIAYYRPRYSPTFELAAVRLKAAITARDADEAMR
jgi:hypothetical protein